MRPIHKISATLQRIPARWQFAVFLGGTVVVSLAMTVISYSLYIVSGTAQLDLSRPGYKQALSEVAPNNNDNFSYPSSGPLDASALNDFQQKYNSLIGRTNDYSAFDPSAISDDQLNLSVDSTSPTMLQQP